MALNLGRAIQMAASRYNLDPRAMSAIAYNESGLRWNAVGDNGTSFGPFQLHVGGALPSGRGAPWADSLAGVMYAARQMAASGAAGKRGYAAVNAISRNFERPANPGAEIATAMKYYNGHGGGSLGASPGGGARAGLTLPGSGNALGLKQQLIQNNWNFATTGNIGKSDPLLQTSIIQNGLTKDNLAQLGTTKASQGGSLMADSGVLGKVLNAARGQIGTPYLWGGESAGKGFDCSGLIQYAYAKAGISLPRTTYDQIKHGRPVKWGAFQPGDLIFSDFEGTGQPTHVVMYIGHGKVIAAPHTGTNVQIEDVNVFRNNFIGARRILN